jgi:hypothetical protein
MASRYSIPFNRSPLFGSELEHIFRTMTVGQIALDQTDLKKRQSLSPMGKLQGGSGGECPVSEEKGDCMVGPPFFNSLTRTEQGQVIQALLDFCG